MIRGFGIAFVGTVLLGLAIAAVFGPKEVYLAVVVPLLTDPPGNTFGYTVIGLAVDAFLLTWLCLFVRRAVMRRRTGTESAMHGAL